MKQLSQVGGGFALITLLMASLAAGATPEQPALGIGGDGRLEVGKPAQVLVSHATYPQLSAFAISVTYHAHGPIPQTEDLGHPDDDGRLNWTPHTGGAIRLKALAPAVPGAAAVALQRDFDVAGGSGMPHIFYLLGIGLGIGAGLWVGLRRRRARSEAAKA